MNTHESWVHREVQREFSASVTAGIGRWSSEQEDPVLGAPLYECQGDRSTVYLHERGIREIKQTHLSYWKYEDIHEVVPLSLRQLSRVRDPERLVTIGIRTGSEESSIEVPLKVYSKLCPTLVRIVEQFRREPQPGVLLANVDPKGAR